jgi:hypothetical protein
MDEINRKTETASDSNPGNQSKEPDKIERAEFAVKRMEEAEKRLDEKIARLTELEANRILGGTAGGHIETMRTTEQIERERTQKMADEIVKAFKK